MEREACVCDHGFERSDLCADIIIIIIIPCCDVYIVIILIILITNPRIDFENIMKCETSNFVHRTYVTSFVCFLSNQTIFKVKTEKPKIEKSEVFRA